MRKQKNSIISFLLTLSMLGSMVMSGGPLVVQADPQTGMSTNLVSNGDFNTGATETVTLNSSSTATAIGESGWEASGSSVIPVDYTVTADGALQISDSQKSGRGKVFETGVNLPAGTYEFSAWVKPVGITEERAYVDFYATKSAWTKSWTIGELEELADEYKADGWYKIIYTFTTETASQLTIC